MLFRSLLKLPETMFMPMFVGMTAMSLVFYVPVNLITRKTGKKKMVVFAFAMFTITYLFTTFSGDLYGISGLVQGIIMVVCGSLPMAIFGILPQSMVADIAEYDGEKTGENRQGMFFAARTFCFKMGQSLAMLLFTSLATMGEGTGLGYRIVAGLAAILCLVGGIILFFFNEKEVLQKN